MRKVVLFTGGGTGGHVFPGIAVIEQLRRAAPALDVRWLGSSSKLEEGIVRRFAVPYVRIPSGKLRRYFSLRNALDVFKLAAGLVASLVVISRTKPVLLFSKGGYVSVPPVVAARILRVPIITHESDLDPGLATRINSRFAETICVAYPESLSFYPEGIRSRVTVTGNPVRSEVFTGDAARGRALLGVPDARPVLLVLGGSQGSREINETVGAARERLERDFFVAHQTGGADASARASSTYFATPFFGESYPDVLAASDLVVCRAGAGTLWELAVQGKPSVLVPLGSSSSRGDQIRNAELFARRGAAVVLAGENATPDSLAEVAHALALDRERLARMGGAARTLATGDASARIADLILSRIGEPNDACTA